jgi:hypothetical protein
VIPDAMRKAMLQSGTLSHLKQKIEQDPEYRHAPGARKKKKSKRGPASRSPRPSAR